MPTILWEKRAQGVTIAIYDMFGAAALCASLIVLGVTRPPALVEGFKTSPVIAWAIVGLAGPVLSVGVLNQLATRALGAWAGANAGDGPSRLIGLLSEGRSRASGQVADAMWAKARRVQSRERRELLRKARWLTTEGYLHFVDVVKALREHAARRGTIATPVGEIMERPARWPDANPDRHTFELIATALDFDLDVPIGSACECAADSASEIEIETANTTGRDQGESEKRAELGDGKRE